MAPFLQLVRELVLSNQVVGGLEGDAEHDDQEQRAQREGHRKDAAIEKLRKDQGRCNRGAEGEPDDRGTLAVPPPPRGDRGVRDEGEQQQGTEVGDVGPGVLLTDGHDDGFSPGMEFPQGGDGPEVEVGGEREGQDQHKDTHGGDRPCQPRPSRPQVEADEPYQ